MPMDKSRYPDDWDAISRQVRAAAGWRCERCGVANGALIERESGSERYHELTPAEAEATALEGGRVTKIVLTVAHTGPNKHDKHDLSSLEALCQRCHLLEDLDDHVQHAAETRRRKRIDAGQALLPGLAVGR